MDALLRGLRMGATGATAAASGNRRPLLKPCRSSGRSTAMPQIERPEPNRAKSITKADWEALPKSIILLRTGEALQRVDNSDNVQPDHQLSLTDKGRLQAIQAGKVLHENLYPGLGGGSSPAPAPCQVFFLTSPHNRTLETTDLVLHSFSHEEVGGVRSAVQLREQDFGNFQDPTRHSLDREERLKFGRFWFRFPNGESGADVYDRLTLFEDRLARDFLWGKYDNCHLVLVTHGLTLRIFLMRWLHWSVEQFLQVYPPEHCETVVLERLPWEMLEEMQSRNLQFVGVKQCYALTSESQAKLAGCTDKMRSYHHRGKGFQGHKASWKALRAQMDDVKGAADCKEKLPSSSS